MIASLKAFFGIDSCGSSLQTEILAGLSTFLALSYIFVVNPAILAQAGMNKSAVLFATILTSGVATICMGLWARLPFVLAPGMEMNAYVAFFVVGALGFTWQQALGAVFWSGLLFLVLTITHVREKIIDSIPERMKSALSLSVGVFLGLIALKIAGLVRYEGVHIKGIGDFTAPVALMFYFSVVLVLVLEKLEVPGAVMISIIATAGLCQFLKIGLGAEKPAEVSSVMFSAVGRLDPSVILNPKSMSVILILFLIDFYGSVAKLIGLTMNTNMLVRGRLPRMREALLIDSVASTTGSVLGTSSITVYVESGVGIAAGGRTGLTAVVCGLLILTCFLLAPFLQYVPLLATTGALLFVAIKLCPSLRALKESSKVDVFALVVMQIIVIATFALDRAMLAGFMTYLVADLAAKRRPNSYLVGSILLLLIGTLLQLRT